MSEANPLRYSNKEIRTVLELRYKRDHVQYQRDIYTVEKDGKQIDYFYVTDTIKLSGQLPYMLACRGLTLEHLQGATRC